MRRLPLYDTDRVTLSLLLQFAQRRLCADAEEIRLLNHKATVIDWLTEQAGECADLIARLKHAHHARVKASARDDVRASKPPP